MSVSWIDDIIAKKRLEDFGVEFTEKLVSIKDIDWAASRTNGARLNDPINEDLVAEYTLAMERGDSFPKTVMFELPGGRFQIASGNHRCNAGKDIGIEKIPAYVVKTKDRQVIDILPRVFNRDHGKRMDRDEAIQHAMYAVDTYGMEHKQAEQAFGLAKGVLSAELKAREAKRLLEQQNIKATSLAKSSLKSLGTISNSNVLATAGRIAVAGRMGSEQVQEMVREVKKNKTEASQIGKLAEYESRIGATKNPGEPVKYERNVRTKFLSCLTTMENYLEGVSGLAQLQITEDSERKAIKQRIETLTERLRQIIGQRGTPKSNGRH